VYCTAQQHNIECDSETLQFSLSSISNYLFLIRECLNCYRHWKNCTLNIQRHSLKISIWKSCGTWQTVSVLLLSMLFPYLKIIHHLKSFQDYCLYNLKNQSAHYSMNFQCIVISFSYKNVLETYGCLLTWCQFHQCFIRAFFVQKSFWQLFSA